MFEYIEFINYCNPIEGTHCLHRVYEGMCVTCVYMCICVSVYILYKHRYICSLPLFHVFHSFECGNTRTLRTVEQIDPQEL